MKHEAKAPDKGVDRERAAIRRFRKSERKVTCTAPLRIYINVRELVGEGVPRSVHSPHFAFLCVLFLYLDALHPSDINHVLL